MFKLQYKIALLQFLVGCAVLLLGLIAYSQLLEKTAYLDAQDTLELLAQEVAQRVDSVLQEKAAKVQTLASAPVIEHLLLQSNAELSSLSTSQRVAQIDSLNQQWIAAADVDSLFVQPYLHNPVAEYLSRQFNLQQGEYGEIFLTNRYGALVASTGKLTTLAHAHKYWWQASYNEGIGKTFFDDRGFDSSVEGYVLGIVVPIIKNGQIIGILKSNINIQSALEKLIGVDAQSYVDRYISIVRDGGTVVLRPGYKPLSTHINSALKKRISSRETGSVSFDDEGAPFFSGYAQIAISRESDLYGFGGNPKSIDHSDGNQDESWHIVVTDSQKDLLYLFQQSSQIFYLVNVAVVFLLAGIAFYAGRRIARPLSVLSAAAKTIGEGQFNTKLEVLTNDEIGEVAQAFNEMVEKLSTTMATKEEYSEEIKRRRQGDVALRQSEETINLLLNTMSEGVCGLDTDGLCTFCNQSALNLLGYEEHNLIGQSLHDLIAHTKMDGSSISHKDCGNRNAVANGLSVYKDDIILWRSDGSWFNASSRAIPISQGGQIIGSVFSFIDITDKKKLLEQQFRTSQLVSLGELAAGMAHEINNPINGVINYAQMLLNKHTEEGLDRDILTRIIKEGGRVAGIVHNLLGFAHKDRDEIALIRIEDFVSEPLQMVTQQLDHEGILLDVKIDDDLAEIYGNTQRLGQIILNLVSNARYALNEKFPEAHPDKILRVGVCQEDRNGERRLQLTVWDQGCGIPKDHLNKIFNPFFTTKAAGTGTGLGLSISHDILMEHDATVHVESDVGQFTKIVIEFPVAENVA